VGLGLVAREEFGREILLFPEREQCFEVARRIDVNTGTSMWRTTTGKGRVNERHGREDGDDICRTWQVTFPAKTTVIHGFVENRASVVGFQSENEAGTLARDFEDPKREPPRGRVEFGADGFADASC
jgi:hypothetical protein